MMGQFEGERERDPSKEQGGHQEEEEEPTKGDATYEGMVSKN